MPEEKKPFCQSCGHDFVESCLCFPPKPNKCVLCPDEPPYVPPVPGSDRWNEASRIFHQAKHMQSSDGILFLDKWKCGKDRRSAYGYVIDDEYDE